MQKGLIDLGYVYVEAERVRIVSTDQFFWHQRIEKRILLVRL